MGQNKGDGEMLDKMSEIARKYQSLLFKTTYLDSYQFRSEYKAPVPVTLTLTPYKQPNIPFNLYHKPDPITRRDPKQMQERCDPPQNMDHEKVLKSRPKVIMTPANDLDIIKEPLRKLLVDDIYLSETARSFNERVALSNTKVVKAPLPNFYSKANPIALSRVREPYVSPEWRMDSVTWDTKQLRTNVDPTKKFWLSREKPEQESPSS